MRRRGSLGSGKMRLQIQMLSKKRRRLMSRSWSAEEKSCSESEFASLAQPLPLLPPSSNLEPVKWYRKKKLRNLCQHQQLLQVSHLHPDSQESGDHPSLFPVQDGPQQVNHQMAKTNRFPPVNQSRRTTFVVDSSETHAKSIDLFCKLFYGHQLCVILTVSFFEINPSVLCTKVYFFLI